MNDDLQHNILTLTAIFESLEDAVLSHDTEHNILQWNPAAEVIFGYRAEEIIGRSIFELIPEHYYAQQHELFSRVLRSERIAHLRTIRVTRSGREFPVSLTISPIKDGLGNAIGASHIIRDITAEKEAEAKQAILASIIETSEDAIISKTLEGIITSWNLGAEKTFGYTAEEAIGKSITILIPKERIAEEDYILSTIKSGDRIQHFQTTRLSKDGNEIPISLTVSPVKDIDGVTIGISKIARNISIEKVAAEKQAMLAAIVESSDDAIISKNLDGIISSWNTGAEKIFGYREHEVIGRHISILIPEYRLDEETEIISSIKRGVKVDHFQTKRVTKSGKEIDISLTVSPIKDTDGNVIGASKVARDITLQKDAEEALRRNNHKLEILNDIGRTISEELNVQAILQKVTDATTQITGADFGVFFYNTINKQGETSVSYTLSGIPKEKFDASRVPLNVEVAHTAFAREGIVRSDDITKDPLYEHNALPFGISEGYLPVVSYLAVPVKSGTGKTIGGLFFGHKEPGIFKQQHEDLIVNLSSQAAIALDNSKLFEEVKELSQKKDEFIALASHELKTPLTSLSGFLQIIDRTVSEGTPKLFVGKSMKMLEKLNKLIGDLFDISKIQSGKLLLQFERIDFVGFVKEVIETARFSHASHQINFTSDGPVFIKGDKLRLEQVLFNLINNAVKYSPDANKIDVYIENNSDKVIVFIKDYGMGISKENQIQIFSQFYRVDGLSHKISGLGLGLYITKEIIERHGGKIMVESEIGKGAIFSFELSANT